MKTKAYVPFVCLATLLGVVSARAHDAPGKPNFVIILADDLGYTDVGCYGASMIPTPAIDRLAREGMRFTDAHSPSASCSPSRYGLLTGEYPLRNPMFSVGVLGPYHPLGIHTKQTTIASLVQAQGYATGVFGKWHVGLGIDPVTDYNGEVKPGPLEVGFGECFIDPGNLNGGLYLENHLVVHADPDDPFYWEPTEAGRGITNFRSGVTVALMRPKGGEKARIANKPECTRIFTEKAVDFIGRHSDRPFLMYFAPNNVHVPITPGDAFKGKSGCGLYGDYVVELDWMVRQVLAALDRHNLTENTFVLFASDNGGGYYKPHVAEAWKHGHRINGTLLGQKTDVWEGGHRVPFIVRWPGRVKPGTRSDSLVSLVDVMASVREILDVRLPEGAGRDSISFLHALTGSGPADKARNELVYQGHYEGLLAMRRGDWVLIPAQGSAGTTLSGGHGMMSYAELGFVNSDYTEEGKLKADAPPGQLYNLAADPSQRTNLYRKHPDKVKELSGLLDRIKTNPTPR